MNLQLVLSFIFNHASFSCLLVFYCKVDIKVIDENDNAPEFPTGGDLSTVIRKESTAGTYVYQFAATDKDAGENGRVTYILAHQFKGSSILNLFSSYTILFIISASIALLLRIDFVG